MRSSRRSTVICSCGGTIDARRRGTTDWIWLGSVLRRVLRVGADDRAGEEQRDHDQPAGDDREAARGARSPCGAGAGWHARGGSRPGRYRRPRSRSAHSGAQAEAGTGGRYRGFDGQQRDGRPRRPGPRRPLPPARFDRCRRGRPRVRRRRRPAAPTRRGEGAARRASRTTPGSCAGSGPRPSSRPRSHHPNVMAVYDWGEDDGIPFMVLELLEGGSLRGMLDAGIRLTPSQAAHVGRQVAAALEYAHGRGSRPPRHQAREPALRRARHRARRRLRPRPRAGRGELDRAGRRRARHRALRVAGAGHRGPARRARRPVRARPGARRVGDRCGAARRRDAARHALASARQEPIVRAARSSARSVRSSSAPGSRDPDDRYPDAPTMGAALDDVVRVLPPPGPFTLVGPGRTVPDPHPTQVVSHGARGGVRPGRGAPAEAVPVHDPRAAGRPRTSAAASPR